jgi:CcmD family protein
MKRFAPVLAALALVLACVGSAAAQQPPRQEVYVPVDSLPQTEQMPAAPLLIGAYCFVIVVFFAYLLSVARRLQAVQREIERVETDLRKPGRG